MDSDCTPGASCVATSAGLACVVPQGGCFPACSADQTCTSGVCVQNQCPVAGCPPGYSCSAATQFECQVITVPVITVTSPGADAFTGTNLQVTATAVAPGGTTGVRFQVLRGGVVLGAAQGFQKATAGDPNNYAGVVPLTGSADGPATVVAIESWNDANQNSRATTTTSPAIGIVLDLTPPALTLVTDGTVGFIGPGNSPALIAVTATDTAGAGVAASGLALTVAGSARAAYAAIADADNQFVFSVPFRDLGTTETVSYSITVTDAVGNVTTVSGDAREVIKVDATAPTGTLTADNTWHAANEMVTVTGTAVDAQSGLVGGLAGVSLTAGTQTAAGTITGSTYSVTGNLATQTFPATENSAFPITVKVSDQVGNVLTLNGSLKVDNKPPTIGAPMVPTGDKGTTFFAGTGADISVATTVLDSGSGVKDSTVSMQYQVGAGAAHALAAGSKGATGGDGTENWTFAVPRALAATACGASPCDGTVPLVLKGLAQDNVLNQGASATSTLFFDAVPPVVAIAADMTWYAASQTAPIAVGLTMTDSGSNVDFTSVALTDGSGTTYPRVGDTQCTASPCSVGILASDLTQAAGGTEGTLNLTLSVKDKVGNIGTATGTRRVDGKPPMVTITKVYATGGTAGSATVTYPTAIPATPTTYTTGYDGAHFLFGDTVHVKATVSDGGSGVKASGFQVRLDGLSGGSVATGTPAAVTTTANSCTDGVTTACAIEFDLVLNGPFDAGADLKGNFGIAVLAKDVAGNVGTSSVTNVAATRFWWSVTPSSGSNVNGLVVHPNGEVIATINLGGNNDSVYALYPSGPCNTSATSKCSSLNTTLSGTCAATSVNGVQWCAGAGFYGSTSGLGAINGAAVIGDQADADGQYIYLGTASGDIVALTGAGVKKWNCNKLFTKVLFTPAVGTASIGGSACESIFFSGSGNSSKTFYGICNPTLSDGVCLQAAGTSADPLTTPAIIAGGTEFVGTNNHVQSGTLNAGGTGFNAFVQDSAALGSIDGLAFDGTNLYAPSNQGAKLYQFTTGLTAGFTATFPNPPHAAARPEGLPVVRASDVLLSDDSGAERTVALSATGSPTGGSLIGVTSPGYTPVLGSDGRAYIPSQAGVLTAVQESPTAVSWTYTDGADDFTVPATMDCKGHLYAAAADTVYAFITDAQGLRNTPWPKYQRDSRNTGNADRTASNGAPYGAFNTTTSTCVQ